MRSARVARTRVYCRAADGGRDEATGGRPATLVTSKNQITLPQAVARRFPGVDDFDVREEDGRIVLEPLRPSRAGEVRARLAALGVTADDVADAVAWARRS